MAKVCRRATSRANSSDDDFSIGKDMDVPSIVRGTKQDAEKVRQLSGRLRLRSRLRKKPDLRSTSTSAYIRSCGLAGRPF
jgi:hypothetical protein